MPDRVVAERTLREEGRLESWKEVATYLKRTVRTVQRWEKNEALPIHRHVHGKLGSVYAYPAELDVWWNERRLLLEQPESPPETVAPPVARRQYRHIVVLAVAVFCLAGAVYVAVARRTPQEPFRRVRVTPIDIPGVIQRATASPTGKYLAYTTGDERRQTLWLRRLATGQESQLLPIGEQAFKGGLTFSPDEQYIYYLLEQTSGDALFRLPALGGVPQRIGSRLDSPVAFSPDGTRMAFVREDGARGESVLLTARPDGSDERRVATRTLPDYLDYPAWSPKGNRIAATSADVKSAQTSVVEFRLPDGRERTIVQKRAGLIRQPAWLPNETGLIITAFDSELALLQVLLADMRSGRTRRITQDLNHYHSSSLLPGLSGVIAVQEQVLSSLWLVPAADLDRSVQLTSGAHRHSGVSWSARRPLKIFFDRPTATLRQIWTMNADGSNQTVLTSAGSSYRASACPDGRHIIFVSDRSGTRGVWKMRPDGSDQEIVVEATGATHPACSPDGTWVYYTAIRDGQWPMLWRVPLNGGQPVLLNEGHTDRPVVSPDGNWIAAFYASGDEAPSVQREPVRIAVLPAAGGPPRNVFSYRRAIAQRSGLRWTPDGSGIAYVETQGESSEIWVQPASGGQPNRAGVKANGIYAFDWSPDGRDLCYSQGTRKRQLVQISNEP